MQKIVILGAGIGGLTLANALKPLSKTFSIEVYERDANVDARTQGYALGLKDTGGLSALKKLGLAEKLSAIGYPGSGLAFLRPSGRAILSFPPSKPGMQGYTHAVPRGQIRRILLEGLGDIPIFWNQRFVNYSQENGRVFVKFESGRQTEADIVVACEGVNSPSRSQMIGDTPNYLGLAAIHGSLITQIKSPLLAGGTFMTLAPGKSFFVQNYGGMGNVLWSLCLKASRGALDPLSNAELKTRALREVENWHSPIGQLIQDTNPSNISVRSYFDKEPLKSARDGRVVLLGDAAHPMSPFRGQGANMAMADAIELADFLQRESNLNLAIDRYEASMLKRSAKFVMESRKGAFEFHSSNPFTIWKRDLTYKFFGWLLSKMPQPPQKTAQE